MARYAYLHGLASGPLSRKGQRLEKAFAARGLRLDLPDLNQPSFAELSHDAALASLTAMDAEAVSAGVPWCFVGSSFGGWLAARWAELHPKRVGRLVLLCPGFDLAKRWPILVGDAGMAQWKKDGYLDMEDGSGQSTPVHYGFYAEAQKQPGWPRVPCPTLIVHGTRDEVVPIETSHRYVREHAHVDLVEVDDDHSLAESIDEVVDRTLRFLHIV